MRNVENDNGGVSGIIPEIRIMTGLEYEMRCDCKWKQNYSEKD